MKKSKIIVPALAVLCLSTAAAVSGTVAWFSAARTAKIGVTSTVINPEGTLDVQIAGKVACTATGTTVAMDDDALLRDASVDVASNPTTFTAYRAILGSSETPTGYAAVSHPLGSTSDEGDEYEITVNSATKTVYYYAMFQADFSVKGAAATNNYHVFFDATNSVSSTSTDKVQNGYRVAMFSDVKTKSCVWAPKAVGAVNYVKGTAGTAESIGTYTKAESNVSNNVTEDVAKADAKFLGTIAGNTKLTVTFVIWYEGTDQNVITGANGLEYLAMSQATYSMAFNAIEANDFAAA